MKHHSKNQLIKMVVLGLIALSSSLALLWLSIAQPWNAQLLDVSIIELELLSIGNEKSNNPLPHDWADNPVESSRLIYALEFQVEKLPAEASIYLTFVRKNARLWLNGTPYSLEGRFGVDGTQLWHRPQLVSLSKLGVKLGHNRVDIEVSSKHPGKGALGKVYFGELDKLSPLYNQVWLIKFGLSSAGFLVTTILCFALAFYARVGGRIYVIAALISPFTLLGLLEWTVAEPPIDDARWLALVHVGQVCAVTLANYFASIATSMSDRWRRVLLAANSVGCIGAVGLIASSSIEIVWFGKNLIYTYLALVNMAALVYYVVRYYRTGQNVQLVAAWGNSSILLLSWRDLACEVGLLSPTLGIYNNVALFVINIAIGGWLALQAILHSNEMRGWQEQLESQISTQIDGLRDDDIAVNGLAAANLRERLAITARHELYNPLASALASEHLLQLLADDKTRESKYLHAAGRQIDRCCEMVNSTFELNATPKR